MSEAQEVGCCGALYLHVITYNKGAIRMYERLGFKRVKKIEGKWRMKRSSRCFVIDRNPPLTHDTHTHTHQYSHKDYYTINSVNYACFLYARYFHGTSIPPHIDR